MATRVVGRRITDSGSIGSEKVSVSGVFGSTLTAPLAGADEITFTPGFGAFVGLEALDRCKAAGQTGDKLETCLERATDPTMFAKGRVPTP